MALKGTKKEHDGKGKHPQKKRDKSRMKCCNCDKLDNFARECSEPNNVAKSFSYNFVYVASTVLLTDSSPLWTVDSRATDHVARDRAAYVEYC